MLREAYIKLVDILHHFNIILYFTFNIYLYVTRNLNQTCRYYYKDSLWKQPDETL